MRIGLILTLPLWLGVVGCDQVACDACTSCSNWLGTFSGEIQGIEGSTCGEPSSLDSLIRIRIYSISQEPQTGEPEWTHVKLEMEHGDRLTEFSGTLCDTQETEQPFSYAFRAEYRGQEVLNDSTLAIHNTMSGMFVSADPTQEDSVDQILAGYTANRITHHEGAGSEFCQMLGKIEGYRK